jgi:hypothetical protein
MHIASLAQTHNRQLPCRRLPASHKTDQTLSIINPACLAKQLERSETKRETSTMQCDAWEILRAARCAPDDDPHHHILTLLGMAWRGMGMANEHRLHSTARKRPLTSASSSESSSQSGPVILDMDKSQVGRPLKVRYTTVVFILFWPYRKYDYEYGVWRLSPVCLSAETHWRAYGYALVVVVVVIEGWMPFSFSPASAFWRAISRQRTSAVVVTASP